MKPSENMWFSHDFKGNRSSSIYLNSILKLLLRPPRYLRKNFGSVQNTREIFGLNHFNIKNVNLYGPTVTWNNTNKLTSHKQFMQWRKRLVWIPYWEQKKVVGITLTQIQNFGISQIFCVISACLAMSTEINKIDL